MLRVVGLALLALGLSAFRIWSAAVLCSAALVFLFWFCFFALHNKTRKTKSVRFGPTPRRVELDCFHRWYVTGTKIGRNLASGASSLRWYC